MSGPRDLTDLALILNDQDNVATALHDLPPSTYALPERGGTLDVPEQIPAGFKLAVSVILAGENVTKYGYAIGHAQCDIEPGTLVHVENMDSNV